MIATICDYDGNADMLPILCSFIQTIRDAFGSDSAIRSLNERLASSGFAAHLAVYKSIEPLLKDELILNIMNPKV